MTSCISRLCSRVIFQLRIYVRRRDRSRPFRDVLLVWLSNECDIPSFAYLLKVGSSQAQAGKALLALTLHILPGSLLIECAECKQGATRLISISVQSPNHETLGVGLFIQESFCMPCRRQFSITTFEFYMRQRKPDFPTCPCHLRY